MMDNVVHEDGAKFIAGPLTIRTGMRFDNIIRTVADGFGIDWLPDLQKNRIRWVDKYPATRELQEECFHFGYVNVPDGTWGKLHKMALYELEREQIRRLVVEECKLVLLSNGQILVSQGPYQFIYAVDENGHPQRVMSKDHRKGAKSTSIPRRTAKACWSTVVAYVEGNKTRFISRQGDLFGTAFPFHVRKAKTR